MAVTLVEDEPGTKEKVLGLCLCPTCPSWAECGEKGGFCLSAIGKSGCINKRRGCICGGCQARKMLGFKNYYYCMDGPEKVQKGK